MTLITRTIGFGSREIRSSGDFSLGVARAEPANSVVVRARVMMTDFGLMRMGMSSSKCCCALRAFDLHSGATAAMGARVGGEPGLSPRAGPPVVGQRGAR